LNLEPTYRGQIFNVLPISMFFGNHPSVEMLHKLLERSFAQLSQLGSEGMQLYVIENSINRL
jgi:hypothetical protein